MGTMTTTNDLNKHANTQVRLELSNPSTTDHRDDGYVDLRVVDDTSGETILWVQMATARFHRLTLGGSHKSPAYFSTHPERIGQQLHVEVVTLPKDYEDGNDRDKRRDRWNALQELGGPWTDANPDACSTRRTNRATTEMVARRWEDQ